MCESMGKVGEGFVVGAADDADQREVAARLNLPRHDGDTVEVMLAIDIIIEEECRGAPVSSEVCQRERGSDNLLWRFSGRNLIAQNSGALKNELPTSYQPARGFRSIPLENLDHSLIVEIPKFLQVHRRKTHTDAPFHSTGIAGSKIRFICGTNFTY